MPIVNSKIIIFVPIATILFAIIIQDPFDWSFFGRSACEKIDARRFFEGQYPSHQFGLIREECCASCVIEGQQKSSFRIRFATTTTTTTTIPAVMPIAV